MDDKLFKLLNQQYEDIVRKIDSYKAEIDQFKNKVYDRMDVVYKEVVNVRLEQSMHTGNHMRISDELKDHEKRIEKLESPSVTAHQIHK